MPHPKPTPKLPGTWRPKRGFPCPTVIPEVFEAAVRTTHAELSMATSAPPELPWTSLVAPDGTVTRFRLRAEHPLVRCMMAFFQAFKDAGGPGLSFSAEAALERFHALQEFILEEWLTGRISTWPEGLATSNGDGNALPNERLLLAAAIADLKWGRGFDRKRLLALAGRAMINSRRPESKSVRPYLLNSPAMIRH